MFHTLQKDAANIEIRTKKLFGQIPNLLHNYTYNNNNQQDVIQKRDASLQTINDELTEFLQSNRKFKKLYEECAQDSAEVTLALRSYLNNSKLDLSSSAAAQRTAEHSNLVDEIPIIVTTPPPSSKHYHSPEDKLFY